MASVNVLTISGNLGADPELRHTQSGKAVCNLSVAVSGYRKDDPTLWVRVTAWEKAAEACASYLRKGSRVTATGPVGLETWMGRDGTPGATVTLAARNIAFQGHPADDRQGGPNSQVSGPPPSGGAYFDDPGPEPDQPEPDDIPF